MHPDRCERLCKALAELIRERVGEVDVLRLSGRGRYNPWL